MKESILDKLFRHKQRRIFVSYRRHGEGAGYGGRLADSLLTYFGGEQCYIDIEHIEPGVDFIQSIEEAISACEVLIVVIGPDWTKQIDKSGQVRLNSSKDWVRIEVSTALKRNIRVIPVLVSGAKLPTEDELPDDLKALCRRQAHELSDTRWNHDVGTLLSAIEQIGIKGGKTTHKQAIRRRIKIGTGIVTTAAIAVICFAIIIDQLGNPDLPKPTTSTVVDEPDEDKRRDQPRTDEPEDTDIVVIIEEHEDENNTPFDGIHGAAGLEWFLDGVRYSAVIKTSGPVGIIDLEYNAWGRRVFVRQDLILSYTYGNWFYMGNNPRDYYNYPVDFYSPDAFLLEQTHASRWTITKIVDIYNDRQAPVYTFALR